MVSMAAVAAMAEPDSGCGHKSIVLVYWRPRPRPAQSSDSLHVAATCRRGSGLAAMLHRNNLPPRMHVRDDDDDDAEQEDLSTSVEMPGPADNAGNGNSVRHCCRRAVSGECCGGSDDSSSGGGGGGAG